MIWYGMVWYDIIYHNMVYYVLRQSGILGYNTLELDHYILLTRSSVYFMYFQRHIFEYLASCTTCNLICALQLLWYVTAYE